MAARVSACLRGLVALVLVARSLAAVEPRAPVDVVTSYGTVRGQNVPVFNGEITTNVNTFYSIPYASPPVNHWRFRAPQPPQPFSGVFDASTIGNACPQSECCLIWLTHPLWNKFGEDCLHLNIYTPSNQEGAPFPVMVWFHGGGYQTGAAFQYPGHFLATYGVVVVGVNYRVGNIGFTFTGDSTTDANAGMLDQVAALKYVKANIAAYGGDPNRVTMFGQSAGASSSSLHMVSPKSVGLFKQAIMESGTEYNFWTINGPLQQPEDYVRQVATQLNCPLTDNDLMVDCLRFKTWEEITEARITCTPGYFCQGMGPVVDGLGGFLPNYPTKLQAQYGVFPGNIMTGITRDDGSLYTFSYIPESVDGGFNRSAFETYTKRLLDFWGESFDAYTYDHMWRAVDFQYTPWPYLDDEYANRDAMNEMVTDFGMGMAWDHQAKVHASAGATVYAYVFDFVSSNASNIIPEWMGAPHMAEIPYVFGLPLLQINPAVREDSQIYFDPIDWNLDDMKYTVYWQKLFTNFAKYGDPTPGLGVDNPFGPGRTQWGKFEWTNLQHLFADATPATGMDWRQQEYAFWNHYMETVSGVWTIPGQIIAPQPPFGRTQTHQEIPTRFEDRWREFLKKPLEKFMAKSKKN